MELPDAAQDLFVIFGACLFQLFVQLFGRQFLLCVVDDGRIHIKTFSADAAGEYKAFERAATA